MAAAEVPHPAAAPLHRAAPHPAAPPAPRFRTHLFRLILATCLPLAVLALALAVWTAKERRADVLRGLDATTTALQIAVDRELRLTVSTLEVLGASDLVDQALGSGPGAAEALASLHRQAAAIVGRRPSVLFNISLSTATAPRQLFNTLAPLGAPLPSLGPLRYAPGAGGPPRDTLAIWRAMVESRQVRFSGLIWGPVARQWLVGVSLPVLRGEEVIAVLTANILPASLGAVLRDQPMPSSRVAAIVDDHGNILARSRDEARFITAPASPEVQRFQRDPLALHGRVEATSRDGVPVYGTLRRLHSTGWSVVHTAPRAEVDAPVRQAFWIAGGAGLVAILFATAGAVRFGGRLGREVESLASDAEALADAETPPAPGPAPSIQEVALVRHALRGAAQDLFARTAAKRKAEAHRLMLMREVDHRAKNALAVALSIVRLAPRDGSTIAFAASVEGRITAMARAHTLLAATSWLGGALRTLAEGELEPYRGRVHLDGPPIRLAAEAVQPCAMLLHELATNAAKHGALSNGSGHVALDWALQPDGTLALRWAEQGGPPLPDVPPAGGFGTRLLHQLAERQLGGRIAFDWRPTGLRVTITLPARQMADLAEETA
ncbi:HWE histidine kinase domain-containing protein [Falsiroseomonas sp. E2-1-a20]|uniref:HWE histidine kinase domain-containing protein n=1 Tax=Falsiroseomonas sp. E2-1-a20 TaxID=3239300 RepID=UPI003F39B3DF